MIFRTSLGWKWNNCSVLAYCGTEASDSSSTNKRKSVTFSEDKSKKSDKSGDKFYDDIYFDSDDSEGEDLDDGKCTTIIVSSLP